MGTGGYHEIRIHGVSGTPPAAMLSRDADCRAARTVSYTDSLTGFFEDPAAAGSSRLQVEAYSWGGLTSSAGILVEKVQRIGWLLMLPYAMANAAYWARPGIEYDEQPAGAASRKATAIAVRWAALLLTMVSVGSVCLASMDLLAWQCFRGGSRVCSLPGWLPGPAVAAVDLLGQPGFNDPSRRLVLAAVIPLAAIGVLVLLSRQSRSRYEAAGGAGPGDGGAAGIILRRSRMWSGDARIRRQIFNHLSAALCVVVTCLTLPILAAADPSDPRTWSLAGAWAAAGLGLACVFASAWHSWWDGIEFRGLAPHRQRNRADRLRTAGFVAALAALAVAVISDLWLVVGLPVNQARDFFDATLLLGAPFLLAAALVVYLAFASRRWLWGVGWAVVLLAAVAVGGVLSGGPRGESTNLAIWGAAAIAVLPVVGLLVRNQRAEGAPRQGSRAHAWRGAAPAVLLGGAVGVGLLFSTSLLVGAADVLNGGQPVTSVAVGYPRDTSPSSVLLGDDGTPVTPADMVAIGPITVRDGVLQHAEEGVLVVYSGDVAVERLTTLDAGAARQIQGLVVLDGPVAMATSQASAELDASCLTPVEPPAGAGPQEACGGNPDGVVSQGAVPVGQDDQGGSVVRLLPGVRVVVADPPQETLVLPSSMLWATTLQPLWVLAVLVVVGIYRRRFRRAARQDVQDLTRVEVSGERVDDVRRAADARLRAAFVHRAERLVGLAGIISVASFLVLVMGTVYGRPPWEEFGFLRVLGDLGLYSALAVAAGLLWLLSQVRTSDSIRRQVGVLWDIATFLPRLAHPFGPPSYGERVVPEITRRVRGLLGGPPTPGPVVILSAHSQGSVIAAAVASRLTDEELRRVRLVTYGSQLRAWFGRVFPAVLGPGALGTAQLEEVWRLDTARPDAWTPSAGASPPAPAAGLRGRLGPGNWVNLFRRSDPIGFPIFSDPEAAGAGSADIYVAEIDDRYDLATHSGYQFSPEYRRVLRGWTGVGAAAGASAADRRRRIRRRR